MKAVIFAYSRNGMRVAGRLLDYFKADDAQAFVPQRLAGDVFLPIPKPSGPFIGSMFEDADAMIFVSSCGIAVREIAPFVHDKRSDPAVICIDELGGFVIPILSGHIGGANELAGELAVFLGAAPVITTATDINHRFSADAWAARNGFIIDDMRMAKEISAAILEKDLPLLCDLPVVSDYPKGTFPGKDGDIGIYIGWENRKPFSKTLHLIPPVLNLGIGCRKGISETAIRTAVNMVSEQFHIDKRAIREAASIDMKADEPGLLGFCHDEGIQIHFFSADSLRNVQGSFSHSDFVKEVTGVDNVCERAAMKLSDRLIVPKTAVNGVTIAVGEIIREVNFE